MKNMKNYYLYKAGLPLMLVVLVGYAALTSHALNRTTSNSLASPSSKSHTPVSMIRPETYHTDENHPKAQSAALTKPYKYDVIAASGQMVAGQSLTGMGDQVSINDDGNVAFVGKFGNSEAVCVGDGAGLLRMISPTSTFGRAVQINNKNRVVSRARIPGNPPATEIVIYKLDPKPDEPNDERVAKSGAGLYCSVFEQPGLSDNDHVVFSGQAPDLSDETRVQCLANSVLFTPSNGSGRTMVTTTPIRPQISNGGRVVFKDGGRPASPILLSKNYQFTTPLFETTAFDSIANDVDFTTLGDSPGVSGDGKIIAFYGELNANGAAAYKTTPGPGIFASINDGSGARKIIRITGRQSELGLDAAGNPINFRSYAISDSRVAVGHIDLNAPIEGGDGFTVSYIATPSAISSDNLFSGELGIWTTSVYVKHKDDVNSYQVSKPLPVIQVNDVLRVNNGDRRVISLSVYDQINSAGTAIGFWASTNNGDVVVRARRNLKPVIFVPGVAGSYLINGGINGGQELWPTALLFSKIPLLPLNSCTEPFARLLSNAPKDPKDPNDPRKDVNIIAPGVLRNLDPVLLLNQLKKMCGGPDPTAPSTLSKHLSLMQYDSLLEMLKIRGGYREYDVANIPYRRTESGCDIQQRNNDPSLFVFAYDWRKNNEDSASELKKYVRCVQKFFPNPDQKITIIAHSMGGLLSRRYILDNPEDHHVENLITINTPWLGAPKLLYALETGTFLDIPTESSSLIKELIEFFPGPHQLMPSRSFFQLTERPFEEKGWDINNDGNNSTLYEYNQMISLLNQQFPRQGSRPGTTSQVFHDYPSQDNPLQDNWLSDNTSVNYYVLYSTQSKDRTIGRVVARGYPGCRSFGTSINKNCEPGWRSQFLKINTYKGDGTVPVKSQSRKFNAVDLNGKAEVVHFTTPADDDLLEHTGLTRNPVAHATILSILNGDFQQQQEQGTGFNLQAGALQQTPTYDLTITGVTGVLVSDPDGNNTAPITNTILRGQVPGVTYYDAGQNASQIILSSGNFYSVTFTTRDAPLDIDLTLEADENIIQAIRYRDIVLPPNVPARLNFTSRGVDTLQYDSNRDGVFETFVTPTVEVTGVNAQDLAPPLISVTVAHQPTTATVSLVASDNASGVKTVYYSTDGTTFRLYTTTLSLNPTQTPILYAFADDNVANRSGLLTYQLTTAANSAELSITKTASLDLLTNGANLVFTIDVTNNGTSDVTGVILTDQLQSLVTFLEAAIHPAPLPGQDCTLQAATNTVTCNIGNLTVGSTATVKIVARPTTRPP